MAPFIEQALEAVDERTGLVSFVKEFFAEDIPASSGWHQVFGSIAMFLFQIQVLTGALLALNFSPSPPEAYLSVQYIMNELTAGRMMRGLHHWGASAMVIVVVLHMIQVGVWGAYKRPREATWMVGMVLLLLTLGFGLTGYLLPWDNKAYWATVVTTQISGLPPIAGAWTKEFLGAADGTVGALTFARFYTLHTMLLPLLTVGLIVFHVILVRKHGVAPQPGDENKPTKKFYPGQVFKDTTAIFIVFTIVFLMAVMIDAPLEALANPADKEYIPRPDWYFLFLFQILKFFPGVWEVVGAVILPTIAIVALILLPFIDRSRIQKVSQRKLAMGIAAFGVIAWSGLTTAAIMTTPKIERPQATPAQLAGAQVYEANNCSVCHVVNGVGEMIGPPLNGIGARQSKEEITAKITNPQGTNPESAMPPYALPPEELDNLAEFLMSLH